MISRNSFGLSSCVVATSVIALVAFTPSCTLMRGPGRRISAPVLSDACQSLRTLDYGGSTAAVAVIEDALCGASRRRRSRIEIQLLLVLEAPDATDDGRDAACRILRRIGTSRSVAPLADLLGDDRLGVLAARALADMSRDDARSALYSACRKLEGANLVRALRVIGETGDSRTVALLRPHLQDSDPEVMRAAIDALGLVGGPEAACLLQEIEPVPALNGIHTDALIRCADSLASGGMSEQAVEIYRSVLADSSAPPGTRAACLRGLSEAAGADSVQDLLRVLRAADPAMASLAASFLSTIPGREATAAIGAALEQLPPQALPAGLRALGNRGDPGALRYLANYTSSEDEATREAAIAGLSKLNCIAVVPLLVRAAADPASESALASLGSLSGPGINEKLISEVASLDPESRVGLIPVFVTRNAVEADPFLVKWLAEPQPDLRKACWQALGELADPRKATELVVKFAVLNGKDPEAEAAENGLVRLLGRNLDLEQRASELIALMPRMDTEIQCAAMRILARLQGASALNAVRERVNSENEVLRDGAIRALASWKNLEALPVLKELVAGSADTVHRVLAFRAYARLLGIPSSRTTAQTVVLLEEAVEFAPMPGEIKQILAQLGEIPHSDALRAVMALTEDEQFRDEAAVAAAGIAGAMPQSYASESRAAMQSLKKMTLSSNALKRVEEALENIEKMADWIVQWHLAGPFEKEGLSATKLLEHKFLPETEPGKAQWRLVSGNREPKNGCQLDLARLIGGSNRVAYVMMYLEAPEAAEARLELGSDDGVKFWLNDNLLHRNDARRPVRPGDDKVPVQLAKGWNQVLFKVTQAGGGWGICARFRKPDGSALPGAVLRAHMPTQSMSRIFHQ